MHKLIQTDLEIILICENFLFQIGEDGELSEFSSPSSPLCIPLDDPNPDSINLIGAKQPRGCNSSNVENNWQKDFERHYIELEELGYY